MKKAILYIKAIPGIALYKIGYGLYKASECLNTAGYQYLSFIKKRAVV